MSDWERIRSRLRREVWFCLASGPSMTQQDADMVGTVHLARDDVGCIAVNNTWQLAKWADVLYAADQPWWRHYGESLTEFKGVRLSWAQSHYSTRVPRESGIGLGKTAIYSGGNSGYQAVNLAYLLGAKTIVLLGYDMRRNNGQMHWHPDHGGTMTNNGRLGKWRQNFGHLARGLNREGVKVINATRSTALECFDRVPLEDVVKDMMNA